MILFRSAHMLLHPRNIVVHPALEELPTVRANVARRVEQALLRMDEAFRLGQRRHVEISEHIAQVLLCHSRADGAEDTPSTPAGLPAHAL